MVLKRRENVGDDDDDDRSNRSRVTTAKRTIKRRTMPADIKNLTEGWLELESDPGRRSFYFGKKFEVNVREVMYYMFLFV